MSHDLEDVTSFLGGLLLSLAVGDLGCLGGGLLGLGPSTGLLGGLALFLFGMDVMTQALKSAAGDYMKDVLSSLTRNRLTGVATGAFVTATIQSSSVTTVLLVGFISAGLMTMAQSVAVIIGANIGTTITAQILAFKVTKLSLPLIAGGFLLSFTSKSEPWRQGGSIVLGLEDTRDRVEFWQGDAHNLKDRFTGYDLVLACNLIDRLYEPARFLEHITERINPGGLLVLLSPYT